MATVLAVPLFGYTISPALRHRAEAHADLGAIDSFPPAEPTLVRYTMLRQDGWVREESKRTAWVVRTGDETLTVFDPRCTHLGCNYGWDQGRQIFYCPCHNGVFDIEGRVVSGPPPRPLTRLPHSIVSGRLLIGQQES